MIFSTIDDVNGMRFCDYLRLAEMAALLLIPTGAVFFTLLHTLVGTLCKL